MTKEYEELVSVDKKGKKTVLSKYGATNPAEFFAVSTDAFFEKPRQIRKKHPELYEQLRAYFNHRTPRHASNIEEIPRRSPPMSANERRYGSSGLSSCRFSAPSKKGPGTRPVLF